MPLHKNILRREKRKRLKIKAIMFYIVFILCIIKYFLKLKTPCFVDNFKKLFLVERFFYPIGIYFTDKQPLTDFFSYSIFYTGFLEHAYTQRLNLQYK